MKIIRNAICFFAKHSSFAANVIRNKIRKRMRRKEQVKSIKQKLMDMYALRRIGTFTSLESSVLLFENEYRIKFILANPLLRDFAKYAICHYMIQDEKMKHTMPTYYVDSADSVFLVQNYFNRNRARLLEWWCLNTENGQKFLNEEDKIHYDLNGDFEMMFKDKCRREFDFDVDFDSIKRHNDLKFPCIYKDGTINTDLMDEVKNKAKTYVLAW